jgi:type III secretory pathway component EscS
VIGIEKSPLEIVREVAPVVGAAAIGVSVGLVATATQIPTPCLSESCKAIWFAEAWSVRAAVVGGLSICLAIGTEWRLE